jgi:D-alanyl-lipoteichoic acid acyltransferase DltB (MBOAT superfamily)
MLVNRLQVMANNIFAHPQDFSGLEVWAGVFLFGFYLYFDFSSLIDIVMGCGQLFGLHFMENFRQPLFASSVTNFWRRWHISLTSWLRDYVFFPLNFATREVRTKSIQHINIMITFLISGIWHGASLNFIIWGGLHGAYLIVEDLLNTATEKLEARYGLRLSISRSVSTLLTFLAVNFAWIFLLAGSLRETRGIVMKLFTCEQFLHLNYIQMGLEYADLVVTGIFLGLLLIVEGFELKNWRFLFWLQDRPLSARWLIYLVLLFTMIIFGFYGNYSNMIDPYYMKF